MRPHHEDWTNFCDHEKLNRERKVDKIEGYHNALDILASKEKGKVDTRKVETVEEFLARGGKITKLESR